MLEPLSQEERREVRDVLDLTARRLAVRFDSLPALRRRLDAAALIGVADASDGDTDLEDGADAEVTAKTKGQRTSRSGWP